MLNAMSFKVWLWLSIKSELKNPCLLIITNNYFNQLHCSAHGGRRWAVPPTSQWLPPFTDLPQSSLMHAWKTYLTDNLPVTCFVMIYIQLSLKWLLFLPEETFFFISYVRSLYRRRIYNAGSRHLQCNLIESDRNSGDSLSGYFILSRDNPICPYKLSKQLQFVNNEKDRFRPPTSQKILGRTLQLSPLENFFPGEYTI